MKKGIFILALLAALLYAWPSAAGTISLARTSRYPSGEILTFTMTTLDSAGIDTSEVFNLGKYDHVSWAAPLSFPYIAALTTTPAGGNVGVWIIAQGSINATTWTTIDTVAGDTLESASNVGTMTFHNAKYPYYRLLTYDKRQVTQKGKLQNMAFKLWCFQDY